MPYEEFYFPCLLSKNQNFYLQRTGRAHSFQFISKFLRFKFCFGQWLIKRLLSNNPFGFLMTDLSVTIIKYFHYNEKIKRVLLICICYYDLGFHEMKWFQKKNFNLDIYYEYNDQILLRVSDRLILETRKIHSVILILVFLYNKHSIS